MHTWPQTSIGWVVKCLCRHQEWKRKTCQVRHEHQQLLSVNHGCLWMQMQCSVTNCGVQM